jgi:hypothetical protein
MSHIGRTCLKKKKKSKIIGIEFIYPLYRQWNFFLKADKTHYEALEHAILLPQPLECTTKPGKFCSICVCMVLWKDQGLVHSWQELYYWGTSSTLKLNNIWILF